MIPQRLTTINDPIFEASKNIETDSTLTHPQHTSTIYIESLASELKTSEKVTKNLLLKSNKWTKSYYDVLSKMITEDLNHSMTPEERLTLGTSLSSRTLQKIISHNYKISNPVDPRTLNTLNKVVFFLGYCGWDSFVAKVDQANSVGIVGLDTEQEIKRVVEEAVRRAHFVYCSLPEVKEAYLTQSYIKDSPSFNLIVDALVDKAQKQHVISNDYNPSTCEILDIEVRKIESNYAQVYTREYWLLCWWDTDKQGYVKRYKNISDHFYILNKQQDRWMVKTNASTSDIMELV